MTHKPLITLLLAGSLLSGCTMIPDYERPDLPVRAEWPSGLAASMPAQQETPVAAIRWQEFFRSEPMRNVIQAALEHNRDLRVAALNVEAARSTYQIQRANLVPNVTGDVAGNKQRISQNIPFQGGTNSFINEFYTAQVSASYGLDFFGRIRSLNRAALQDFLATEEAQKAVQVSLIAEVANAYLQLQADRAILQLTEETLESQEKAFGLISQRFEKGVGSQLDVSQAQIPVETARVNHALYTRLVEQDKNALAVLIGKQNADDLMTHQPLDTVELMESLPMGLPSEVLLLRPDVRQAEHALLSANANIGAARAAFFPSISLTGSYGQASAELSDLFTGAAGTIWSFSPSISVPIFQGGRNFANLDLSKVNKDIAIAQYEKAIQVAFREVADELAARATLDEQQVAQTNLVAASQKAYDVSNARYNQGIDSFLTVLDAQRSLYEAQQSRIETEKQRLANLVNLYKVLGGGQLLASEDVQAQQDALKAESQAAVGVPTYRREITVVTDTPEGQLREDIAVTTLQNAEGEQVNVAEKTIAITPED